MLRASALSAGAPLDVRAIGDSTVDLGVPAGRELLAFTEALIGGGAGLDQARNDLIAAAGSQGAARAALTAGNFEMMNRVLDATGVPVPASMRSVFAEVGVAGGR